MLVGGKGGAAYGVRCKNILKLLMPKPGLQKIKTKNPTKPPILQNPSPPLTHPPNAPQQDHSVHLDADRDVRRQGGYGEIIFGVGVAGGG